MGKIYRIPVRKNRSSIDPVDRGYTLFFGCFSALVCFIFLEDSVIGGAGVALVILLTPLLLLFVVGLFWDHHPKTVGFLSAIIAAVALALSIFVVGFVLYRSYIEEPSQYCLGPLKGFSQRDCPILFYQERLTENPILILNEIVPLLLCLLVFSYALIKAIKLGRSSQDSETSN